MNLRRLVVREILHRKLNFALSVLGVFLAVLCVIATLGILRAHDAQTDRIIGEMEVQTRDEMAKLEDEIRKSMKGLGFNIYIFPEDQEMSEVYAQGYASKSMPEEYVNKLASSDIVTVNHLLPSLTRKIKWPEKARTVILIGVRGEVPLAHRDPKAPLIDPVEEDKLVLGYELHRSLDLAPGDTVEFMGESFTVEKCHDERGSKDDITIWMNLGQCQELLQMEGRINAIQALECNCATVDRLGEIRKELLQILPDTRIIETGSTALARAEARNTAQATAERQIAGKKQERARLRRERERFAGLLLPIVSVFSMAWIGMLTLTNVRERIPEIGILRAIGVKSRTVLTAFLGRAFVAGLTGAALGLALAFFAGPLFEENFFQGHSISSLLDARDWWLPLLLAPLFACLAAWLPSFHAAQQDPAVVLRHD